MFTFEQIEERKGNMQQKELPKISRNFTSVTEEVQKCISWYFPQMVNRLKKMNSMYNYGVIFLCTHQKFAKKILGPLYLYFHLDLARLYDGDAR